MPGTRTATVCSPIRQLRMVSAPKYSHVSIVPWCGFDGRHRLGVGNPAADDAGETDVFGPDTEFDAGGIRLADDGIGAHSPGGRRRTVDARSTTAPSGPAAR